MAVDLELTPKVKRPAGEPCCAPVVYPDVERDHAARMAAIAKALGDPVRLQLVRCEATDGASAGRIRTRFGGEVGLPAVEPCFTNARLPSDRATRRCGLTCSTKNSSLQPSEAQASCCVSAILGTGSTVVTAALSATGTTCPSPALRSAELADLGGHEAALRFNRRWKALPSRYSVSVPESRSAQPLPARREVGASANAPTEHSYPAFRVCGWCGSDACAVMEAGATERLRVIAACTRPA